MRRVHIEQLPLDRSIIVGAVRWRPADVDSDVLYKVGANLADNQDTRRTFFVVYPLANTPSFKPKDGTVTARWKLFGLSGDPLQVVPLRSGYVVSCKHNHTDTLVVSSGFRGCPAQDALNAISAATGIPYTELVAVADCEMDLIKASGVGFKAACRDQRAKRLLALQKRYRARGASVLNLKLEDFGDPSSDAYWFACANGCCTADDPI
jgi:hypothetical protein